MGVLSRIRRGWQKLGRWRWVLLVMVLLAGWWGFGRSKQDPASQVITSPVARGNVEVSVLATGVVEAEKTVEVGAQASGQIKRLAVQLGDRVKKGDLLAEIDPEVSQNALDEALANIDSLKIQQTIKQLSVEEARQEYERQQLMMSGDATPKKDVDSALTALKTREAELRQLATQLRQAELKRATAQANLGYTRIVAPMDGVVVSIATREGQTVNAIQTAPTILTLANLDMMKVKAQVAEADVVRLKAGTPLYFSVLGAPEKRFEARVLGIEPLPQTINNAIFYNALFQVPNEQGLLRPQMTAQVTFVLDAAKQVLTVPVGALSPAKGSKATVTVLGADGKLASRQVEVGLRGNVTAEIRSGLRDGERVVIGGGDAATGSQGSGRPMPGPGVH
ncbi:efflux RND transporter periplasmic adaptor subunit [Chitinilyticum piscinae]|uniref:Efflux RND transporter periplasmic adaptor subunit n=1 Tax=Chitinilyticum piscinae TaxID=2866724 RepID=A0A8J7FQ71_9NEIS|nr:efflux RND transporter periplasmic adaptor subunit [Chitinilyticum piscinae]MBE9608646.1 efflux RND transporter periplasmic adaptor subunit [Chitinilyticum piscinae]